MGQNILERHDSGQIRQVDRIQSAAGDEVCDRVDAVAGSKVEYVVACTAREGIVSGPTIERIADGIADQYIGAGPTNCNLDKIAPLSV